MSAPVDGLVSGLVSSALLCCAAGLDPLVMVSDFPCLGSPLLSKSPGRLSALLSTFSSSHLGMSSSSRSPSQCG